MVWTCGRISRPLGASISSGVTRTTRSPGETRSPVRDGPSQSVGAEAIIRSLTASMPSPVSELTLVISVPSSSSHSLTEAKGARSILFATTTTGTLPASPSFPVLPAPMPLISESLSMTERSGVPMPETASMTRIARSTCSSTCQVFSALSVPSSPTSSIPAVSINVTGPIGGISIALYTGSAVVPGTSETRAIS